MGAGGTTVNGGKGARPLRGRARVLRGGAGAPFPAPASRLSCPACGLRPRKRKRTRQSAVAHGGRPGARRSRGGRVGPRVLRDLGDLDPANAGWTRLRVSLPLLDGAAFLPASWPFSRGADPDRLDDALRAQRGDLSAADTQTDGVQRSEVTTSNRRDASPAGVPTNTR